MSFLDDIFDWLGDLFDWLMDHLLLVLAICAILFIAFAPLAVAVLGPGTVFAAALPSYLSWLPGLVALAAESWWIAIPAGLGLAYVFDPEYTSDLVNGAAETIGDVAGTVGEGVGDAVGSTVSSFFGATSGLWLYGGIALAAYLLLSESDSEPREDELS